MRKIRYGMKSNGNLKNYQPKGSYASANHNHDSVYQPKGSYASSSHNHDDLYTRSWCQYKNATLPEYNSTHKYFDFKAPYDGIYLFIVNFRPIDSISSCMLKINSTGSDPIGGVSNVPQYAFESFSAIEGFNANATKKLLFEVTKGCNPTIRIHIIKIA